MKAENSLDKYIIYASGPNKGLNKYGEDPYKDIDQKELKRRLAAIKKKLMNL